MDVRDDLLGGTLDARPALGDVLEELQVLRGVHGGARPGAVVVRGDDPVAGGARRGQQGIGALGHLGILLARTADQEVAGIVAAMALVVNDLHDLPLRTRPCRRP